jgi:putative intracellular protease/amidase
LSARSLVLNASVTAPPVPKKKPATSDADKKVAEKPESATSASPQPISRRARQHRVMVHALLAHLKMVDPKQNIDRLTARDTSSDKTWVALYDAGGTGGKGPGSLLRILSEAGMNVVPVGPDEIVAGSLAQFHMVIFPGGTGSGEASAIGEAGRKQVRQFVEQGGGYMGICAGAYLCLGHYDWSLHLLNGKTVSPYWNRGGADLKLELTPQGRAILGDRPGLFDVRYHSGPVICPAKVEGLANYEVLAYFRTEINGKSAPPGQMIGSPAIACGPFGKGRVMFISPHPEQTAGLEDLVVRAAR